MANSPEIQRVLIMDNNTPGGETTSRATTPTSECHGHYRGISTCVNTIRHC